MGAELGVDVAVDALADHRWTSADHGRTVLHVEDFSRIPFLDEIVGIEEYQHRARIRARTGDHFVGLTPLAEGYDEYCRDVLGLGAPEFMLVEPIFGPLRIADACRESEIRGRLVELTQDAGKLVIHPYMSAEPVWELAAALARDSGAAVKVVGPPPPVTWVANDKNLLSELVRRTAGADFILDTLARTLARCLSGGGNPDDVRAILSIPESGAELALMDLPELRAPLHGRLLSLLSGEGGLVALEAAPEEGEDRQPQ